MCCVLRRLGCISIQDLFTVRNLSHLNFTFQNDKPYPNLFFFFCNSRYDFFIVSQAVRSGSVSPTHYNVIYDSSGLKPDHIQRLTYKLCHVYYNWPVSIFYLLMFIHHNEIHFSKWNCSFFKGF